MPIDFTLSKAQQEVRHNAGDFAQNVLARVVKDADASPDPHEAFVKTKPSRSPKR